MTNGLSNGDVTMTSRDPQKCLEAVRSAIQPILVTAGLHVSFMLRYATWLVNVREAGNRH